MLNIQLAISQKLVWKVRVFIYAVQVYRSINQFRGYKLVDQVCVIGYGGKYKHTVAYPVTQV